MPERTDCVVVGAGLLGLAVARSLRRRGREVVVLERATVGHDRGGSKGASRIFRLGYTDPRYVRMAVDALPLWKELEAESGRTLLQQTGQVTFGPGMRRLYRAMLEAGAPVQELTTVDIDGMAVSGPALYEPESAVIDATATLAALRGDVREHTEVTRIDDDGWRVRVDTTGESIDANVAIVCPGPWSKRLLHLDTFATLEHVAYFRTDVALPIFIEFAEPVVYGLPTAAGYKVAQHHAGPHVDPDTVDLRPDPEAVDAVVEAVRRLLPGVDPTPLAAEACMYDNTATEDFVLERRGNVVIGAGTSGHGFKFGPLLGERLADLATR